MKKLSVSSFFLALSALVVIIYTNQYSFLPLSMVLGILGWAMWPNKKEEKPYRDFKTWEGDDVR